jgi:hypothetical protein
VTGTRHHQLGRSGASPLEIASEWPAELEEVATSVSKARHDAAKSAKAAGTATAKATRRLDGMGLSRRDTAEALGISHQRVQQRLVS